MGSAFAAAGAAAAEEVEAAAGEDILSLHGCYAEPLSSALACFEEALAVGPLCPGVLFLCRDCLATGKKGLLMATLPAINYGAVAGSGVVLALPHTTGLQSSLPLLQKNYKFSKVFFWGKLMGMTGDYLIAMGIEESYGKAKFFYWCVALPSIARSNATPRFAALARSNGCAAAADAGAAAATAAAAADCLAARARASV